MKKYASIIHFIQSLKVYLIIMFKCYLTKVFLCVLGSVIISVIKVFLDRFILEKWIFCRVALTWYGIYFEYHFWTFLSSCLFCLESLYWLYSIVNDIKGPSWFRFVTFSCDKKLFLIVYLKGGGFMQSLWLVRDDILGITSAYFIPSPLPLVVYLWIIFYCYQNKVPSELLGQ